MIVSHSHKFVFVKTPKTAGTSIVSAIRRFTDISLRNYDMGDHEKYYDIIQKNSKFENYFSFSFVRNPWDLRLSRYFYLKNIEVPMKKQKGEVYDETILQTDNFRDWCKIGSWFPADNEGQYSFMCNKNEEFSVDFVGRYENLTDDFNHICDTLNLKINILPSENTTKHKHYTEYYDEETKSIVAEKYAKDIEYFGYKFGE
tara:strand:+ start:2168 stop:2770 length:603 start_codon:yes stop_codon:yes gene_type:complete